MAAKTGCKTVEQCYVQERTPSRKASDFLVTPLSEDEIAAIMDAIERRQADGRMPTQHGQHLEIHEMWSVQALPREAEPGQVAVMAVVGEPIHQDRGIDDDHRASRSARR